MSTPLESISPLDGRYFTQIKKLSEIFSEKTLMRYRLMVEIEYLIALSDEKGIKELETLTKNQQNSLRKLYNKFSLKDAEEIKKIEQVTNHDVKSVEYYLKKRLANSFLKNKLEFIHFALTSEDINNIAYCLMWRDGIKIYLQQLKKVQKQLKDFAILYKRLPLLSLTHGQPASPSTLGKEFAVFYYRLKIQSQLLEKIKLTGKLNGAVGNWNAHKIAYQNIDWLQFSQKFVKSIDLEFNPLTTQIEPHDILSQSYDAIKRINVILADLSQDIWLYISRDIFKLVAKKGEVGSSTMPHKVNPIQFENAESNARLAATLLSHLSLHLPISRMQRDLRDSTLIRNQGTALGHSYLAVNNIIKGLQRITPNNAIISSELDAHWEVLAEPIQMMLRKLEYKKPYETLKQLTHGRKLDKEKTHNFIKKLNIPKSEKNKLLKLTPHNYIGLASKLVDKFVA